MTATVRSIFLFQFDGFIMHNVSSEFLQRVNPPQNRHRVVVISHSKQQVDDFVSELTFCNHLTNALCEIRCAGMGRELRLSMNHIGNEGATAVAVQLKALRDLQV